MTTTWQCEFAPKLNGWVVEAIDPIDSGVYVTQFYGPLAEDRAKAYAAWMNEAESVPVVPRPDALRNAALQAFGLLRRIRDRVDAVQFFEADAVMGMIEAALAMGRGEAGAVRKSETPEGGVGIQTPRSGSTPDAPHQDDAPKMDIPSGWKLVPFEPTEAQWGELARDIVMFQNLTFKDGHTGETLRYHLDAVGRDIPEWLHDELRDKGHLPKGTIATLIYKAMLDAAPASAPKVSRQARCSECGAAPGLCLHPGNAERTSEGRVL